MRRRCYRDVGRTRISPALPNRIHTSDHRGTRMQFRSGPFFELYFFIKPFNLPKNYHSTVCQQKLRRRGSPSRCCKRLFVFFLFFFDHFLKYIFNCIAYEKTPIARGRTVIYCSVQTRGRHSGGPTRPDVSRRLPTPDPNCYFLSNLLIQTT